MRKILPLTILGLITGGCSDTRPSLREIRSWQMSAKAGPTEKWQIFSVAWATNTPAMRDAAYIFCAQKHPADEQCFADQDWSLIAANHAEAIARNYMDHPSPQNPRERALADQPRAFEIVRSHCMSIYRDAGSADARMLGPCMMSAVGGDYFSIMPVS